MQKMHSAFPFFPGFSYFLHEYDLLYDLMVGYCETNKNNHLIDNKKATKRI